MMAAQRHMQINAHRAVHRTQCSMLSWFLFIYVLSLSPSVIQLEHNYSHILAILYGCMLHIHDRDKHILFELLRRYVYACIFVCHRRRHRRHQHSHQGNRSFCISLGIAIVFTKCCFGALRRRRRRHFSSPHDSVSSHCLLLLLNWNADVVVMAAILYVFRVLFLERDSNGERPDKACAFIHIRVYCLSTSSVLCCNWRRRWRRRRCHRLQYYYKCISSIIPCVFTSP